MSLQSCIPIIPSADLEKSLKFWRDALEFDVDPHSYNGETLTGCMLKKDHLYFLLNIRDGVAQKPDNYEGIRLYWAPQDIDKTRSDLLAHGFSASEIVGRDYGRTEFFVTDDDGHEHCFGVATSA